jgi:enoyl-CoA hydratase
VTPTAAVRVEEIGDTVLLALARPERRNAIDQQMVTELHEACSRLEADPRVALIIGDGESLAAGADIAELRERRATDALRGINSSIFDRIRNLPMPTIAFLDGYAFGGGAELAYACDFRIGTPRVKIGHPEPGLGILAAAGASWRLAELVGEPVAKEVLLAGRVLNAVEALALHLLNDVVEPASLLSAGQAWAERITRQAPLAIRLTKSVFHAPRDAHLLIDDLAQAILFETDEKRDRMTTFLNRKKPD